MTRVILDIIVRPIVYVRTIVLLETTVIAIIKRNACSVRVGGYAFDDIIQNIIILIHEIFNVKQKIFLYDLKQL